MPVPERAERELRAAPGDGRRWEGRRGGHRAGSARGERCGPGGGRQAQDAADPRRRRGAGALLLLRGRAVELPAPAHPRLRSRRGGGRPVARRARAVRARVRRHRRPVVHAAGLALRGVRAVGGGGRVLRDRLRRPLHDAWILDPDQCGRGRHSRRHRHDRSHRVGVGVHDASERGRRGERHPEVDCRRPGLPRPAHLCRDHRGSRGAQRRHDHPGVCRVGAARRRAGAHRGGSSSPQPPRSDATTSPRRSTRSCSPTRAPRSPY